MAKKLENSPFSILLTFQMCNKKRNKITWNDSISPWNSFRVSNIFYHFVTKQKSLEKNVFWTNLKKMKVVGKIMRNSLSTSCPFWQQEEYELTSADVLYQMVDLCDDNDDLLCNVEYLSVTF